jgi:hypothetical protein
MIPVALITSRTTQRRRRHPWRGHAKGAAQLQSETTYTVAADPHLPIQVIEPAY